MRTHLLLSVFCAICLTRGYAEEPQNMRLFLLIGQSNMAGRGKVEASDQQISPAIWSLDQQNIWVPARDPLHFDKPKVAGVGLASEFARCVVQQDAKTAVGLIPCAFGGTALDQWKPGSPLYTNAIARTKIALRRGYLAGILWHQGEADCAPSKTATYATRFSAMIAQMRTDLGTPDVPVIVGELGYFNSNYQRFNTNLAAVVSAVPRCQRVTAQGLEHGGDKVHFSARALREYGQRYFQSWRKFNP